MPELLLELFSEEIPARMQARAAQELARLVTTALAALEPSQVQTFHGPRRIALVAMSTPPSQPPAPSSAGPAPRRRSRRWPVSCASMARAATQVAQEGEYWVLRKQAAAQDAAA